jgi:hypothetical protein
MEATDIQSREKIKSRYLNASLPEFYTFFHTNIPHLYAISITSLLELPRLVSNCLQIQNTVNQR